MIYLIKVYSWEPAGSDNIEIYVTFADDKDEMEQKVTDFFADHERQVSKIELLDWDNLLIAVDKDFLKKVI